MGIFDPDDFLGDPYGAGTNQGMHWVTGSAVFGFFSFLLPFDWALGMMVLSIVLWETHQRIFKGASLWDFKEDLFFWLSGGTSWAALVYYEQVTNWGLLAPFFPLLAFIIAYWRRL